MGDFIKESTDPKNIAASLFIIGSTVVGGGLGFLASTAAVGAASAQVKGAGAKQVELDLAARTEKLAAQDREVARQRRLNAVLGAQAAEAAAMGVGFSGSVANVSISDAEQAGIERLVDRTNTRVTLDRIRRSRKSVGKVGTLRAATTLLSAGGAAFNTQIIDKPAGKPGGSSRSR